MRFAITPVIRAALRAAAVAVACAIAAVSTPRASAATITPYAAFNDVGPAIVTQFGTSGYDLYNTQPTTFSGGQGTDSGAFLTGTRLSSFPSYVASVTANGAGSSFSSSQYARVNNPVGGQVYTGFTYRYSTPNVEQNLLRITVGSSVPSTFYVGVMTNLDNNVVDFPDAFRLLQSGGGSGNSGLFNTSGPIDGGLDAYFFQVSGATAGDLIDLSLVGHVAGVTDNKVHLGTPGLLFSTAAPVATGVPLPRGAGPAMLTAIVAGVVAARARRRGATA